MIALPSFYIPTLLCLGNLKALSIQSVAFLTPTDATVTPGVHYCAYLSPFAALEFMHVAGLRGPL